MIKSIRPLLMNIVRIGIIAPIKKVLALLKDVWLVCPKKSRYSVWHSNNLEQCSKTDDEVINLKPTFEPINWRTRTKVEFPGVCVLPKGKLLMYQPVEALQRHPDSRKAIVFTRNYRPLEYNFPKLFLSFRFMRRNFLYWLKGKNHSNLPGHAALLGNYEYDNDNYFHFWVDVIADIWYIRQHLTEKELPDYYLVPFANLAWQWHILKLCGIHESQVIPYSKHFVLTFDKLIVPIRDKGATNLPSWLCSAMHEMSGWSPILQKGARLIFVSRADADRRRVANESAIRERLREQGFEVHTLNGLSVMEQQQLFASAAIICTPHGAALTNLVWCGPGTVIIDLLSDQHLVPCFRELAAQNRLFYYPYVCKQVEGIASGLEGDIIVADFQIESVLDIVAQHVQRKDDVIAGKGEFLLK